MQTAIKRTFLAAVLCALAGPARAQNKDAGVVPAGPQQTAGEAANLEKKETGVNAEEHPMRQDNAGKQTTANHQKPRQAHLSKAIGRDQHNARVANTSSKTEVGQRAQNQQKRVAAGLKTGQLTSSEAAKLQTKRAALHREVQGEENGGQLTAGEKAKVNHQQNKTSNEIHQKKHNARMF
jgi:hypothetical protein